MFLPLFIERKECGWARGVPSVAASTPLAYVFEPAAWNAVAVAEEGFGVLKVIETSPQRPGCGVWNQA